jgi:hypothetical protein
MKNWHLLGLVSIACFAGAGGAYGQIRIAPNRVRIAPNLAAGQAAAKPGTTINLPYSMQVQGGTPWLIYPGGFFRQNGNVPVYGQGAQLIVDNNSPNAPNNQARLDAATGEVVIDNLQANQVSVTRRIKADTKDGSLRIIDIFSSRSGEDQQIRAVYRTSFNFMVQSSDTINDPKDKNQSIAWVGMTQGNRAAMEWYGGLHGASVVPDINYPQGSNQITVTYALTIPAGKEVALVHVHQTAASQQVASDLAKKIDPRQLLADVPPERRRLIVNIKPAASLPANLELLRGDLLDVVELRNGDMVTGTLAPTVYKLTAPFGAIDVPSDKVLGVFNVGEFKPRQLIVTTEGEILGGTLAMDGIGLTLPGGQATTIPLKQISRVGMRQRPTDSDDISLKLPHVVLREGDHIAITPPTAPLSMATRFGPIEFPIASVASISFQNDDSPVHIMRLTDGSTIAGLMTMPTLDVTLKSGPVVKLPISSLDSLQLVISETPTIDEDETPVLRTSGDDALVGTLSGQLELATAFDLLKLDAAGIRGITRVKTTSPDFQVTTWDGATVSGRLMNDKLTMRLICGMSMDVPSDLLVSYSQPQPQPSATMMEQIKTIVADLNAADWKQRDLAESQLVKMGPSTVAVLKQLRTSQPAEVQQRIDSVLKQLDDK